LFFWEPSSLIDTMRGSQSRCPVLEDVARAEDGFQNDDEVTDSDTGEMTSSFVSAFTVPWDSRNRI